MAVNPWLARAQPRRGGVHRAQKDVEACMKIMLARPSGHHYPAQTNGAALKMSGGLPRVAQAGTGVVHTFALAVHAPIALRAALFR